jgi:hypothetical protein
MYSLHLANSPWFLLLIPPGLWILWRQYRGFAAGAGGPGSGRILFALQAAAMIVLALSLTAPELRRHRVEFHNPAILILRDQSSSFRAGAYLGLGGAYRDFQARLEETYRGRKFDVRVADFAASAWPVSGFARASGAPSDAAAAGDGALTSLAASADFVDSAAIPNLQAVFLFSDGVSNLDSGRASRTWRFPLYPVVFAPDSVSEIQPVQARVYLNPEGAAARADLEVAWRRVGKAGGDPALRILQGGRTLLARKLPAGAAAQGEAGKIRFPWNPDRSALESREPLRAVLQPSDPAADFDPWNDTLGAAFPQGRAERVIHVLRPVRSLDEKGMLGILQSWEGTRVDFFGPEDVGQARFAPAPGDQIWVEAGSLSGRLQAWLAGAAAKAVVYVRSEAGRGPQVPGIPAKAWRAFSAAAELKASRSAAEAFPDEAVRLKSLADAPLELPEAGEGTLVEAREGGKRGMLMGRIPLGEGRRAFFFCLPAVWGPLFDPQGDFATRENIAAYVRAAHALAAREDGTVRVTLPARAYHQVPFDVDAHAPDKPGDAKAAGSLVFAAVPERGGAPAFSQSWTGPPAGAADARIKGVSLAQGRYRLELRAGADVLWRDSLDVLPRAALELARIGFDRGTLDDAATRSGGRVIEPGVSSMLPGALPDLPGAQIRMEKTSSIRLYNTLVQCLLILALLSLSWLLRKKWDFD